MATSGTVTFKIDRDTLIKSALRLCGAIDPENTASVTATMTSNASEALNMLVKTWETSGIQLWEKRYAVVFPQKSQASYILGGPGPGGDHACLSTPLGSGFVTATVVSQTGTSLTLSTISTTGTVGVPSISIATGWNIGIQQPSGSIYWTTVNGAPVGNVVTLTTSSGTNATSGAYVFAYQTKLFRPLRITDGFVRQQANQNDVPCMIIPRENYNRFGNKSSSGTSIQLMYDPQLTSGALYVYPTPVDPTAILYIEIQKPIDDFNSSTDDYDLPQEWVEALKYNLALRIAPEYGVPREKYDQIKELAVATFQQLEGWDQEPASVYFMPNNWNYSNGSSK